MRLVGGQRHRLARLQAQVVEEPGRQHAHVAGVLQRVGQQAGRLKQSTGG